MSDYMLLEYLKNQGMKGDEYEMLDEFKQYMRARGRKGMMRGAKRHKDYHWDEMDYNRHDWDMSDYEDSHRAKGYMRDSRMEGHFDEMEAKEIVADMFHYEMNRRHTGEHFDMKKAEDVYKKCKDEFVVKASPEDVYVAINATYHDFCGLLKSWFGSNIDEKIIMLAVTFWFKDDDYQGNKLMDYFE